MLYCLTGRTFRSESRKLLYNLWIFKGIRITCTTNPDSDKQHHHYHQQLVLIDRNHYIHPQQQRINPTIQGAYL